MRYEAEFRGIVKEIEAELSGIARKRAIQSILFLDLVGSTSRKLESGHERGLTDSLTALLLFRKLVEHHGGNVVKEMGDGVLARFDDPLNATLSALATIESSIEFNIQVKGAITIGMVDLLASETGHVDVIGSTVDRCARIQSFCLANQLLVDRPFLEVVRSHLKDYSNIEVGDGRSRLLKGIGETELFEISTSETGLRQYVYTAFNAHEEGRLPIDDKVNFVRNAQAEVVEMGTGLRTFSGYFSLHRPSEFRNYIQDLVAKGTNVTFLVLDPEWDGTASYLHDRGEPAYLDEIVASLGNLKREQMRLRKLGLKGEFDIRLYRSFPSMHVLCVDPDDRVFGRMLASPYLFGLSRSEAPVMEFSALSNPEMFGKYKNALLSALKEKSVPY